jgi:sugar phosphate permease
VWPVYLLAFVTMLAFYMGPTQVPFVLAAVGVSPASMGLMIAISALAGGLTSLMYARLRARLTVGTLAALGLALLGAAWVLVGTADSLWQIVLGLLVNGVASGVLLPNFAVWLSALATPETRGRLLGGLTTAIFLGQFVSPLAAQPLVAIWDLSGAFVAVGLATMTLGGFMALRTRGRWAVAK